MELATYTNKLRTLAESFFREEKTLSSTKRCCISIKQSELSIVCISRRADADEVSLLDKIKFDDFKTLPLIFKGIIEKYDLSQTPLSWLLHPDDYQLDLIESMPVPETEFLTALSWRIRSLINYPIEEAVLEYFELPAKKNAPNSPLIGAVTAQKTRLNPAITLFKECGLQLVTIGIPEIAILNLAALYENDEKSSAFLYFYEKFIILNISNRKVLYFTRRINISFTSDNKIDYEKLSLEILRYFDFFCSQWRFSPPARIFSASSSGDIQVITKILSERLMHPVTVYTLNAVIMNDKTKNEIATKYLLDYGCLLKQGSMDVKTGN